jgi:hypothetical protein
VLSSESRPAPLAAPFRPNSKLNPNSATANTKRPAMSHHNLRRRETPDFACACSSRITLQA